MKWGAELTGALTGRLNRMWGCRVAEDQIMLA